MSGRWEYRPGMTPAERDQLEQDAAEYGMAERDGDHDEHQPPLEVA
jgi:hypothetical protein